MEIVLFTHPQEMASTSMPRFAAMLRNGLESRGHAVTVLTSRRYIGRLVGGGALSKWVGYFDQFVLFPVYAAIRVRRMRHDTLFVFCDQALGPWVPLVTRRPHVIHCHDFLALRSALDEFPQNPTSWTGKIYQRWIRWGFSHGRHFISISHKTRSDLERYGLASPQTSMVVWNGLNYPFRTVDAMAASEQLRVAGLPFKPGGMLLNVAGGQWYKNRIGVALIYIAYAASTDRPLPLWFVGPPPDAALQQVLSTVGANGMVHFVQGIDVEALQAAYSLAAALIFPSLEEGFGWPIIEAQACGCPVLTTDAPPMSEIAGPAATLIPRAHGDIEDSKWAKECAQRLVEVIGRTEEDRIHWAEVGRRWASGFTAKRALDSYFDTYVEILSSEGVKHVTP